MSTTLWIAVIAGPTIGAMVGYIFGWRTSARKNKELIEDNTILAKHSKTLEIENSVLGAENALLRKQVGRAFERR